MGIISWIVVGGLAGWIASIVMGTNERQGCVTDIVLGILGACLAGWGYWLLTGRQLLLTGINIPSIVVALVGACIVIAIKKVLAGRRV